MVKVYSSRKTKLNTVIQVKNLNYYYGKVQAIAGVSINIFENKVTAIIGPSGCGKSTFLKSLNRINEVTSQVRVEGTVEFFGQNIYHRRVNLNRLRRQIAIVFEKPNLFPMSIYDNVAYGIKITGWRPRAEINKIVESAIKSAVLWDEVKDKLDKSALNLSGDQQQRLCIACALAVKPKVLLMDDPCSALDPIATMKIEQLIHSLQDKLTIVIVTRNIQQAIRVSDFTAFFCTDENRVGHMLEFGTTTQIFTKARDERTRDYVGRYG